MSLETTLEELNANIVKLIAVMSAGGNASPAKSSKVADSEDAGDTDKPRRGPGRPPKDKDSDESSAGKKPSNAKAKVPTEDDIRKVFGEFMRVDDEEDREKRKTFVKNVLKEYGVAKATDLKDEDRQSAIDVVLDEGKRLAKKAKADEDDDLV
jgi:hypothetical protein